MRARRSAGLDELARMNVRRVTGWEEFDLVMYGDLGQGESGWNRGGRVKSDG